MEIRSIDVGCRNEDFLPLVGKIDELLGDGQGLA